MHRTILSASLALFALTSLFGQESGSDWRVYKPGKRQDTAKVAKEQSKRPVQEGKIDVVVDPRILLMDSLKRENPTPMEGYRVQIFFGSRADAQKMRGEFLRSYPDIPVYISYLAPNFRLRVGDFRTKMECEKLKKEIQDDYRGCYIVKDEIQLPALRPGQGTTAD